MASIVLIGFLLQSQFTFLILYFHRFFFFYNTTACKEAIRVVGTVFIVFKYFDLFYYRLCNGSHALIQEQICMTFISCSHSLENLV
jgi:hypothetical protein